MIGVLLNRNALGVRTRPDLASQLRDLLGADGVVVDTAHTDEVGAVLERFDALGCDLVGICGGDGTNLSTLTGYLEGHARHRRAALPRFVLLRGGTVNTVAKNLGVEGRPEEILARLVTRVRAGTPLPELGVDTLAVNGRHGFLFAAAMGARFLEAYYRLPRQGAGPAAAMAARTVGSSLVGGPFAQRLFRATPVALEADGVRLPLSSVRVLCAATVPDVGIGMRLMWQAGREPGRFHIFASAMSTARMSLQVHRVLGGRPLVGAGLVDQLARTLVVRFEAPEPYTLDGELFRESEIVVSAGPRLRVVIP